MAENELSTGSLMDTGINLEEEALDDLEIEALSNGLDFERPLPEGIEIIEEDDGGVTLDFDGGREREIFDIRGTTRNADGWRPAARRPSSGQGHYRPGAQNPTRFHGVGAGKRLHLPTISLRKTGVVATPVHTVR